MKSMNPALGPESSGPCCLTGQNAVNDWSHRRKEQEKLRTEVDTNNARLELSERLLEIVFRARKVVEIQLVKGLVDGLGCGGEVDAKGTIENVDWFFCCGLEGCYCIFLFKEIDVAEPAAHTVRACR